MRKGKTYKAIAAEVSGQQEISYQTVRRILQKDEVQQSLLKTEVTEEYLAPPSEPVDRAPVVKISKEGESQYAGAMLLHVALGEIGLWSVFEKVGALVGQTKLGVKQVVGTIALGFALQLRSIEGFKTALRGDFGMLLGLANVPGDVLRFLSKKNDVWFPKLKPVPVMGTEKENHTSWERYYRVSDCSSSSRNDWYLGR